jgi:uncharacterized protein
VHAIRSSRTACIWLRHHKFRDDSDIDFLVEFRPEVRMGLFKFIKLRDELADLLGREVDLVPKDGLKPLLRDEVFGFAELVYAA